LGAPSPQPSAFISFREAATLFANLTLIRLLLSFLFENAKLGLYNHFLQRTHTLSALVSQQITKIIFLFVFFL
jgi:hypothetical protein